MLLNHRHLGFLSIVALACASCLGSPTSRHLVAVGDAVRVSVVGMPLPATNNWQAVSFKDEGWVEQVTAFSPALNAAAMPSDIEIRRTFDIGADYASFTSLTLDFAPGAPYDVYVNGQAFGNYDGTQKVTLTPAAGLLQASGNVLALAVHATTAAALNIGPTLDGVADPKVTAGGPAHVVRGPWLLQPTTTGTSIVWETDVAAPSVAIVDGKSYDGGAGTHHAAQIAGLEASHSYPYHIEVGTEKTEELELTTAPADKSARIKFVVYGDNRTDGDNHRRVADAIRDEGADFVINTGDLVNSSSDEEWQTFFDIEYSLLSRTPMYPALGNHEENSGGAGRFAELFPLGHADLFKGRVYSFDYGSVHVAVLDSNSNLADQVNWLDQDLTQAEQNGARHEFVVMHWGAFSGRKYLMHGANMDAQKYIVPVARKHKVDALLAGHDHFYERGNANGLRYFVTGGGGAPLADTGNGKETDFNKKAFHYLSVDIVGDVAHVSAKDPNGVAFDSVDLSRNW
jgi:calcineurin-like phosphoesterase family protein